MHVSDTLSIDCEFTQVCSQLRWHDASLGLGIRDEFLPRLQESCSVPCQTMSSELTIARIALSIRFTFLRDFAIRPHAMEVLPHRGVRVLKTPFFQFALE